MVLATDTLYQVALTLVPQLGPVQSRLLIDAFGSAQTIFKTPAPALEKIEGIGTARARSIKNFRDFAAAEKELRFIEKYKIKPLFITDQDYPQRLLNCYDPPTLLYYKGTANLNSSKIVSVIGTRTHSTYGELLTESLVRDLATQEILIISGLAFGVDARAHKSCIKNELPTVAVLAHGLDSIYPQQHNGLAREILKRDGGLLTEFRSFTKPDKHNFPTRNRIVAGICDAVVVIESGMKGGSMVTAEIANGYNKDIFAFPGRITDTKSAGCNFLIQNNKAMLVASAADLLRFLGWDEEKIRPAKQRHLFVQLNEPEKKLLELFANNVQPTIDELIFYSGLNSSGVAAALLNLELNNIIKSMPGKKFRLVD